MRVTVLFFATLRDRAGGRSLTLELPEGTTAAGLKASLAEQYPSLKASMASVLIAINREYAFDETVIPAGAEIGMFPPVSGGDAAQSSLAVSGRLFRH